MKPSHLKKDIELPGGWRATVLLRGPLPGRNDPILPDDAQAWKKALASLLEANDLGGANSLKTSDGVSVQRARLSIDGAVVDVVVKQARPRRLTSKAAVLLRGSRERRSFDLADALLSTGVPTARPVALLERGRARRPAVLITEYLPDLVDLDHVALSLLARLEPHRQRGVRDALIHAVAQLTASLERAGWRHRDYKASNILIENWEGKTGRPRAVLIDLDGLAKRRSARRSTHPSRHLVRLAASLLDYPSIPRTDYARFVKRYLAAIAAPETAWRPYFRKLAAAASAYNRRAATRRRKKLAGYDAV